MRALRACVATVRAAFPSLTLIQLEGIFLRDKAYISNLIKQGRAA